MNVITSLGLQSLTASSLQLLTISSLLKLLTVEVDKSISITIDITLIIRYYNPLGNHYRLLAERSQLMPRVWNKRHKGIPKDAVYVGRPTEWGNPYLIGVDGTREEVVEKFRQSVLKEPEYIDLIKIKLKGKDLVCWCAPKACHADILLEIANK